ncbi:TetR/AcrR family transcriptional regulator [Rubinisphaera margarita]|uniref:TetR/AcrR family transcriptional regulator n=1 Tax=Rubinisphaera margarita TaxID=2909586 RepID=UPI001EE906A5|nr:CerR family C-terminal domain-containing protein [Rubinisphaera margarita]MCG6158259.1 CerR family C-terminal domain-containing protein [Rubinisphaera margarita]
MPTSDESTRVRLLDAAGAVFADRGFDKATVREICTRADVNLAAVNYHFGDKARLYVETLLHAHEVVFDQVPLPEWVEDTPPQKKLADFIETMLQRMLLARSLPWQARLMMREFVAPTTDCRELVETYIEPHNTLLMDIIGEMVPAETPQYSRFQIAFSVVGQCMFYKMNSALMQAIVSEEEIAEHFGPAILARHITAFSLAALGQTDHFQNYLQTLSEEISA